jgi:CBS domain-containing protein
MRVHEILAAKSGEALLTVQPTATVSQLMDLLAEYNVGALVVSEDGTSMLGIVSERDIVRKLRHVQGARDVEVAHIMSDQVAVCTPGDTLDHLMAIMTEQRVRHVPVVADDAVIGIVSIGDAVKHRMRQLEFERDQLSNYVAGG